MTDEFDPNQADDLASILKSAQLGDQVAESAVHQRFVARLVRLASSRINQRFRAKIEPEEIVQSVFVSFFRRQKQGDFQFEDWNDLWALLVKITIRKCAKKVDNFLAAKRDVSRELSGKASASRDTSLNAASDEPLPHEVAIFNETLDQLFDRLPELLQTIVAYRLQGLSNLEISEKIKRSERTVYRSLNQVREIFLELDQDKL
ncbi:MAG: ECF-type sigma factor [Planctomycetota bacterium]